MRRSGCLVVLPVLVLILPVVLAEYLLPGDVVPKHYDVRLVFDVDPRTNYSFFGVADILLDVKKTTSKIVLHAQEYTVAEDKVVFHGAGDLPAVTSVKLNDTYNFLTLTLNKELVEGSSYRLQIPFYGNLKIGLDGVYISTYVNKKTKLREYLIATQFEAISARKGFPCFDEPIYKATFRLNIGHHEEFTAVSNMPLFNTTKDNALEDVWSWETIAKKFRKDRAHFVWDQFENSVPMSTYLVAFVVSQFSYVESPPELANTKFRIWARSDAIDQTAYAANLGPRVLSHFERWFNVSFPLPKQDMIAIPDFSAGAMENWGLVTYRETALLYDNQQSSFLNKERVAEVIAHELAHQWFGNLVTMKWWSDLWLNEGFATYAASVGVAAVEPGWRADRSYALDNILSVLSLDALESSHPVSVPIDNPKRISEIFDEISYRKGSTIIRMMTMFLGEHVFREAINNYLVKHSYGNAEQDDLWAELTAATQRHGGLSRNVTVKQVMDTWTTQTGYPLLTVTRDYTDNSLTISQKRYLSLGARASSASSWWVPLRVLCEGETQTQQEAGPVQWLAAGEGTRSLHRFEHGAAPDQWVIFNTDMIAPYRVNYDPRNWQLVSRALASGHRAVPVLARVQLLSDALELAWAGRLDYTTALQLTSYLQKETDYLPLSTGLRALAKIENVLKRTPDYGAFQKFVRRLIGETYNRSGGLSSGMILNEDDLISVKMQVTTSSWACRMKVPGCEENAIALFDRWMESPNPDENNPIPLDLRRTVYCVALSRGSVRHWRFALERRRSANVAAARDQLLHALACSRDTWILAQYLEWAITEGSEVRRQDAAAVLAGVTRSTVGYYVAKDFIYDRIQDIYNAFSQGRRIGFIIKTLLDQFTTQKELDQFLVWKQKNEKYLEDARLAVEQGVERARVNIDWLARHRRHVVDRLRDFSSYRRPADQWEDQSIMLSIYAIHNLTSIRSPNYVYEIGKR
ncbi:PREDICTED: aminopeptidase N-like isoform X2 [Papilio xuthus]|uniref:Aminopeptidase n=1 Tax=Papilio xuthus TaxID=66420 RepID=A0AAJ7E742_PAPXU|nr:PREDICTED: aminopeptidase N-like isoform X2 [Papilio xuthus]